MEKFSNEIGEGNIIVLMIDSEEKLDAISEMAREILDKRKQE